MVGGGAGLGDCGQSDRAVGGVEVGDWGFEKIPSSERGHLTRADAGWKPALPESKDCNILLAAKDILRGTAGGSLNWATSQDITTWKGLSSSRAGSGGQ